MSKISIQKVSESFIKIHTSKDIERELHAYFSFESPGAKFTPLYKAKRWDGIVRLFNLKSKTLYAGLYNMVLKFAELNNYETEYISTENYPAIISKKEINHEKVVEWIKTLDLHDGYGNPMEVRDYQVDAFIYALTNQRSIILSVTGSGKSLIIYLLVRYFNLLKKRMILIVPSVNLVEQMYNDFADYALTQDWDVSDHCQEIFSGKSKDITKSLTISTWQSLISKDIPENFFEQFDVVFGDEAHLFSAKNLTSIMEKLVNAKYRIATTGTLDDDSKVHLLTLTGLFGSVFTASTYEQLMEEGSISKLKIKSLILKHPDETRKVVSKYKYQNEIDYIVGDEKRNMFLMKLAVAASDKGNTLLFVNLVDKHAKRLLTDLQIIAPDRKIFGIFGNASVEDIKKEIAKESNCIIVASYVKFSTGANVPSIKNIIFGSPVKSYNRVLQSIGRGVRLYKDKEFLTLYDIIDDFSWKNKKNTTFLHGYERIKIYNQQKFNYKIIDVKL